MEGRFDLVVLHIGGNDIDQPTVTPANAVGIGMDIYMFAKELLLSGVKRVVISQVVGRAAWRNCTEEDGAKRVASINEFLEAACGGTDKIALWKHKGLWRADRSLFRHDGVHFNDLGNYRLLLSMRGAILVAIKAMH